MAGVSKSPKRINRRILWGDRDVIIKIPSHLQYISSVETSPTGWAEHYTDGTVVVNNTHFEFYIMININGFIFPALVDSGATSSTIRFDIVSKLNLEITKCPEVYCSLANGAKVNILGTVALKNDSFFDNKKFVINASIFGTSTYPVILGNDFAQAVRLCYNYQNRKIYSIFSGNLFESNAQIIEISHNMIRFSAQNATQVTRTAQPLESTIPQPISTDVSADPQNTSQLDSNNPKTVSSKVNETTITSNIEIKKIFKNNNLLVAQEIDRILKPIYHKKQFLKNFVKRRKDLKISLTIIIHRLFPK